MRQRAADKPLTIKEKGRSAQLVERRVVAQHYHVAVGKPLGFEAEQRFSVGRQKHVVRIEPKQIIPRRLFKGVVARGGEIVDPFKVVNFIRKTRGDLLRTIAAAGVDNNNFVHTAAHTLQTACEHFFFVSDNHAQADRSRHKTHTPTNSLSIQCMRPLGSLPPPQRASESETQAK